ncbi:MAG: glycosyltransferase family 2 protein [Paraglaciecola sp.]
MNNELISIVSATFNSEEYIIDTYQSLLRQSYIHWEWVVTDDCSEDNSFRLLERVAKKDSRVKIFRNLVNSGAAVARNKSLSMANGSFIAFIDSDDIWSPSKLEQQISFMGTDIDFSFTAYYLMDESGTKLGRTVDSNQKGGFSYEDMLRKKATLGCSTVMIRKDAFPDIQMPLLRTGQDYATWLKLLRAGGKAFVIPEPLTGYRILPNSISRNKVKKAKRQWQIYREVESLRFFKSLECFLFYAWRAVFRK